MKKITAEIELLPAAERKPLIFRTQLAIGAISVPCVVRLTKPLAPGKRADAYIELVQDLKLPKVPDNTVFKLIDGMREIATGKVKRA